MRNLETRRERQSTQEASTALGSAAELAPASRSALSRLVQRKAASTPGNNRFRGGVPGPIQLDAATRGALVASGGAGVQRAAEGGVSGPGGTLPFGDRIQEAFGRHDVSGVRAHTGGDATAACDAIGARAYATGSDVAFGGAPDLHTAAHEAAHVVQQRGGVQLSGGVGQVGDVYEQHADAVADLVVQGRSAEGVLDRMAGRGGSSVQRKAVQMDATAAAAPADIRTRIQRLYPNGVTVAIYAQYRSRVSGAAEFVRAATEFAEQQNAVGITAGGQLVLGRPVPITSLGEVSGKVQAIHAALAADGTAGGTAAPGAPAPNTQVRSLALFSHGESFGVGLDQNNAFGLQSSRDRGRRERPNTPTGSRTTSDSVTAFVRALSGAVTPDIHVQLFACSAARDARTSEAYADWVSHGEGERRGQDSFASELAEALGPNATVAAHTTVGHVTNNYAARVFGRDAGGGQGGIQIFELLYPRAYIEEQVALPAVQQRLHGRPGPSTNAAADYTAVREAMWAHYRSCATAGRRMGTPPVNIAEDMMANPTHAAGLLRADWAARMSEFLRRARG